ncbi:mitochondrial ATP synthase epsilon chain-domain-containing protein [Peziza echinospora]|nr:mitochondrial ATP synthase epsilon chain-domain-containing protein [Peziza echinospora]
MVAAWKAAGFSYNKYLAIAARVIRRSLKDQPRLAAERRGEMDLKMSKWAVRSRCTSNPALGAFADLVHTERKAIGVEAVGQPRRSPLIGPTKTCWRGEGDASHRGQMD